MNKPKVVSRHYYRSSGCCLLPIVTRDRSPEQNLSEDMARMLAAGWQVQSQESIHGGVRVTYIETSPDRPSRASPTTPITTARSTGTIGPSPDGRLWWNGYQWISALSPDGRYRWDGYRWVAM